MSQSFSTRFRANYQHFLTFLSRKKAGEHDLRTRFIEHVIRGGLGYDERSVLNEVDRTDIWLLDSPITSKKGSPLPTVVIETKDFHAVTNARLSEPINIDQAFKYARPGATRYVGLTNFKRFILWSLSASISAQSIQAAIADIDLQAQSEYDPLGGHEVNRIAVISQSEIKKIYDNFDSSQHIDLADANNFETFTAIVKDKILDSELIPQFQRLSENLAAQLATFSAEKKRLEQMKSLFQRDQASSVRLATLETELRALISSNRPAIDFFENYEKWQNEVYPAGDLTSQTDRLIRFASETSYTLLSRMLLVRIAEDKGVLNPNLSDGQLAMRIKTIKAVNTAYKLVLEFAFKDAQYSMYNEFFHKDVFDWYWEGDGELNESVKKALWHLNQYVFSGIQKDVFKYIYQYHMDKDERKRIGEYYTPDEVVRYILNAVGFTANADLRQLKLLDPGCGSGTFLVEAVNRLKMQGFGLTAEEIIRLTTGTSGSIFGFDVNPFAVYLTESNLLFQLIDVVRQIGKGIEKFQVYRTDSLEPASGDIFRGQADAVKSHRFDFVVGNPPYVRTRRLLPQEREAIGDRLKQKFPDILDGNEALGTSNLDLYIVFTAFGIDYLNRNDAQPGKLGFIETGKFLTGINGQWLRKLILGRCVIQEIVDLTRVKNIFKTQDVYPIILILRHEKDPVKRHSNSIKVKVVLKNSVELVEKIQDVECSEDPTFQNGPEYLAYTIPQRQFEEHPENAFEIYLSGSLKEILAKIAPDHYTPLGEVLSIDRGAERGGGSLWEDRLKKLKIKPYGNNFIVKAHEVPALPASEKDFLKRYIDGDTVAAFVPELSDNFLCYDKTAMSNPKKQELFEQSPKIILPRRAQFLFACLDTDRKYTLDDTYVGTLKTQGVSYDYLLGLLNSRTLDFFHKMHYMTRLQEDWFDYYDYTLSSLPFRKATPALERDIEALVRRLVQRIAEYRALEKRLSSLSDMIAASGISITKGVGLSRLVRNKGGMERRLETIRLKDNRIEFNRKSGRTVPSYIEMYNQAAATILAKLLNEKRNSNKGQVIGDVLDKVGFPADFDSMQQMDELRKAWLKDIQDRQSEVKIMQEDLDWKVAEVYGLSRREHAMMVRALTMLTLTQGLEHKSRSDATILTDTVQNN